MLGWGHKTAPAVQPGIVPPRHPGGCGELQVGGIAPRPEIVPQLPDSSVMNAWRSVSPNWRRWPSASARPRPGLQEELRGKDWALAAKDERISELEAALEESRRAGKR